MAFFHLAVVVAFTPALVADGEAVRRNVLGIADGVLRCVRIVGAYHV